jgi:predicted ArsR family transcriptional regulator
MENGKPHPDARRRRQILDHLKLTGGQEAASLAKLLGVSAMAVRQHLYTLQAEGLVTHQPEPRPVGRPAKRWCLTEGAEAFFPDSHQELAVGLLGALREAFGADGIEKLLAIRTAEQVAAYGRRLKGKSSLAARLRALATARSEEGYMAELRQESEGDYLLIENHCPVCSAARACQGLCTSELEVFQRVLGPHVTVVREDHILAGARRCAYRVQGRS